MDLLMKARKYTHLSKTTFEFLTYNLESKEYMQTCELISNMDRSRYSLVKK